MLTMVCDWPWEAAPRTAALELDGDLGGAVAFGLVRSEEELREVTAMICAGLPDDAPCRAVWTATGDSLHLEVRNEISAISQTFVRQEQGFAVKQEFLQVHPKYYSGGHARRLIKNLLILYDTLGVKEASTHANYIAGSYVWALFGARPKDPHFIRGALGHRLATAIRAGEIPEHYRTPSMAVISDTRDEELMQEVAALAGDDGTEIGRILLLPLSWEGYWDAGCPVFRSYIKGLLQ